MPGTIFKFRSAHTADLDSATLTAVRDLLDGVFDGEMTAADWDHCLGGMHVLAYESGELIGHGAVVQRQLVNGERIMRCGYVEGVGVRADQRRKGIGALIVGELDRMIRAAYDIGALGTTDMAIPFYVALGWKLWEGKSAAMTPRGVEPTPEDDGGIYVLEVSGTLDRSRDLICDWRAGDVW